MKVLLIGSGGREHALAWRILRDAPATEIIAAPGNPGIAMLARCVPVSSTDLERLLGLARDESVDLTIVGPEAPLAAGIVDRFRSAGLAIFGPTAGAAQIETSKAFSKSLMAKAGVPTARAVICTTVEAARAAIADFGAPVVVKASGLAAGKGVIVCQTTQEAHAAVTMMLSDGAFGAAGSTVLVEEFMSGEELSVFVVTDGLRAIPLIPAQDHKRLLDGDQGPNTGGMGAYAPVSIQGVGGNLLPGIMSAVIDPVLAALEEAGHPFTGLLYAGLMLTPTGPRVVEFNCRFGDPETQAILPILDATPTLFDLMSAVAFGERLPGNAVVSAKGAAVTTVIAAAGYPESPRAGDTIRLPASTNDLLVFHAGTKRAPDGSLVAAGGRVLTITGLGGTVAEAARRSREAASAVEFSGKQFRRDIGWRELARRA